MDALFAKADAIRSYKRRKFNDDRSHYKKHTGTKEVELDSTAKSVLPHTALPKSLRPGSPPPNEAKKYSHIPDKKLRAELSRQSAYSARSKALLEDAAFLLEHEESGVMEVEGELERTWRVGQDEIVESAGQEAAKGRREWKLDGGPYRSRYTRNGRYMRPIQPNTGLF
jgi:U3 small nucleolar RNA-associated protein 7